MYIYIQSLLENTLVKELIDLYRGDGLKSFLISIVNKQAENKKRS